MIIFGYFTSYPGNFTFHENFYVFMILMNFKEFIVHFNAWFLSRFWYDIFPWKWIVAAWWTAAWWTSAWWTTAWWTACEIRKCIISSIQFRYLFLKRIIQHFIALSELSWRKIFGELWFNYVTEQGRVFLFIHVQKG